jgi:pSer/pThr/pTyr-binding forkhead associated (FHA) protein
MTEHEARELVFYLGRAAHTFALPAEGRVTVGRSSDNDVRIDDPSVSRRHLCLHVSAEIQVEDLGSANGTYLVPAPLGGETANEDDEDATHRNKDALGSQLSAQTLVPLKPRDSLRVGSVFAEVRERALGPGAGGKENERERVLTVLASCGGNQTRAAKLLGVSRRTLVNRLHEYDLPRPKKF